MTPMEERRVRALRAEGCNCAQAVAAGVLGRQGAADELMRGLRGFGSGLSTGHNCGCLVGAAYALGLAEPETGPEAHRRVRRNTQALVAWFEETFGSVECAVLKSKKDGAQPVPCDELILRTCERCSGMLGGQAEPPAKP